MSSNHHQACPYDNQNKKTALKKYLTVTNFYFQLEHRWGPKFWLATQVRKGNNNKGIVCNPHYASIVSGSSYCCELYTLALAVSCVGSELKSHCHSKMGLLQKGCCNMELKLQWLQPVTRTPSHLTLGSNLFLLNQQITSYHFLCVTNIHTDGHFLPDLLLELKIQRSLLYSLN